MSIYYKCQKCSKEFSEIPIEHGDFIVNWDENAKQIVCDGFLGKMDTNLIKALGYQEVCCPYCCSPIGKIVFDENSNDYVCVVCNNRFSKEEYNVLVSIEI